MYVWLFMYYIAFLCQKCKSGQSTGTYTVIPTPEQETFFPLITNVEHIKFPSLLLTNLMLIKNMIWTLIKVLII